MAKRAKRVPEVVGHWIVQVDEFGMELLEERVSEAGVTKLLKSLAPGPERYVLRILDDRRKQFYDPVGYRGVSAEDWLAGRRMVSG